MAQQPPKTKVEMDTNCEGQPAEPATGQVGQKLPFGLRSTDRPWPTQLSTCHHLISCKKSKSRIISAPVYLTFPWFQSSRFIFTMFLSSILRD